MREKYTGQKAQTERTQTLGEARRTSRRVRVVSRRQ